MESHFKHVLFEVHYVFCQQAGVVIQVGVRFLEYLSSYLSFNSPPFPPLPFILACTSSGLVFRQPFLFIISVR